MKRLWAIAIIKDIKKPTQSKQKKFRDFNPDWLLMIKINAGMLPLPNWTIARLYKVTGMIRIPNRFVKETEICVFKDAHQQNRIQNILYSISDKYRVVECPRRIRNCFNLKYFLFLMKYTIQFVVLQFS